MILSVNSLFYIFPSVQIFKICTIRMLIIFQKLLILCVILI